MYKNLKYKFFQAQQCNVWNERFAHQTLFRSAVGLLYRYFSSAQYSFCIFSFMISGNKRTSNIFTNSWSLGVSKRRMELFEALDIHRMWFVFSEKVRAGNVIVLHSTREFFSSRILFLAMRSNIFTEIDEVGTIYVDKYLPPATFWFDVIKTPWNKYWVNGSCSFQITLRDASKTHEVKFSKTTFLINMALYSAVALRCWIVILSFNTSTVRCFYCSDEINSGDIFNKKGT